MIVELIRNKKSLFEGHLLEAMGPATAPMLPTVAADLPQWQRFFVDTS